MNDEVTFRDKWQFEYAGVDLWKAAQRKVVYHNERLAWWEAQNAAVMAEVRESGIEVSESQAALYSNTTRHMGPQVMVRNDLQRKLEECHIKTQEHSDRIREYEGWVQVLSANATERLKLSHADWLFFFAQ